ncbi:hypothetical protein ACLMJK_002422 [Lecanora helva]
MFRAHGTENGGIHDDSSGAYSIVLSSGYANVDHGNTMIYCGTRPKGAWASYHPKYSSHAEVVRSRSPDPCPTFLNSSSATGNTIIYCGTKPQAVWASINPSTAAMRKSLEAGHQIRVLGSSCSTASGPYCPVEGLRYDGVYTITSSNLVDAAKHDYRFTLQRVKGAYRDFNTLPSTLRSIFRPYEQPRIHCKLKWIPTKSVRYHQKHPGSGHPGLKYHQRNHPRKVRKGTPLKPKGEKKDMVALVVNGI